MDLNGKMGVVQWFLKQESTAEDYLALRIWHLAPQFLAISLKWRGLPQRSKEALERLVASAESVASAAPPPWSCLVASQCREGGKERQQAQREEVWWPWTSAKETNVWSPTGAWSASSVGSALVLGLLVRSSGLPDIYPLCPPSLPSSTPMPQGSRWWRNCCFALHSALHSFTPHSLLLQPFPFTLCCYPPVSRTPTTTAPNLIIKDFLNV